MTPDILSNELTAVAGDQGHIGLKPNELHGRVRMARFSLNTGAGATVDDTVGLCRLPKNARIIEIFAAFEAMGTSATVDLGLAGNDGSDEIAAGVDDDFDMLASVVSVAAAGSSYAFANTIALGYGYELQKECLLVATVKGANWAADKELAGHVLYVTD